MTARPRRVAVNLPHPSLPSANWADCYQVDVRVSGLTAEDAARLAIGHFPAWVRSLMRIRDAAVGVVGLKPSTHHLSAHTDMIGIFPVISRSPGQIVLGIDDRHLDFRLVIDVDSADGVLQVIRATTLVDRKILLGRLYIAAITPFHKLVVGSALTNLGRQLTPVTRTA
ncbi:DUF2867 domain-containing protein [Rhizobium leguminosarum]|uniref:DUF2867 domain-containing protein n=1 Tax=Rhizobium leguminosarum TaxID=384 RepID=A0ABD7PK12_RHILE|nr:DUF2867 domain-containing protein [Rhizobium leguminosarum]TAV64750.1 DUF2867 domain-containing protein [Rhizobium leguminosarum]TAV65208.1 DUF2867 domain-containing protein [Rhizobium leguminosarum]TAW25197.1 DUF2867 domain-containing protein [Rhizobium leguminosarum]TAW27959.1 DUF2867 domain-containing protein [Rhizobium leguminosarum]TAZ22667.1 DUF2867 domain-containing protein [Rhizobium leguminosarum]